MQWDKKRGAENNCGLLDAFTPMHASVSWQAACTMKAYSPMSTLRVTHRRMRCDAASLCLCLCLPGRAGVRE